MTSAYAGGGFDGMIDMAYSKDAWLMPDGSAAFASSEGTTGSMGVYEPLQPRSSCARRRKVHFGADYVFCDRERSPETYGAAVKKVCAKFGVEAPEVKVSGSSPYVPSEFRVDGEYLSTLVHRELCAESNP